MVVRFSHVSHVILCSCDRGLYRRSWIEDIPAYLVCRTPNEWSVLIFSDRLSYFPPLLRANSMHAMQINSFKNKDFESMYLALRIYCDVCHCVKVIGGQMLEDISTGTRYFVVVDNWGGAGMADVRVLRKFLGFGQGCGGGLGYGSVCKKMGSGM